MMTMELKKQMMLKKKYMLMMIIMMLLLRMKMIQDQGKTNICDTQLCSLVSTALYIHCQCEFQRTGMSSVMFDTAVQMWG